MSDLHPQKMNVDTAQAAFRLLAGLVVCLWLLGCTNDVPPVPGYADNATPNAASTTGAGITGVGGSAGLAMAVGSTGVGGAAAVGTTGPIQCQPGFELCGSVCVDTLASPENCGACGTVCPEGRLCASGACSNECVAPYAECSGTCVQLTNDSSNCGDCGNVCPVGNPCVGGVCGCPEGTLFCGGQCIDPLSNVAHCGTCDAACPIGSNCLNGDCECPAGTALCGNECVSLVTAAHCGSCDNVCGPMQICSAGQCIADTEACPAPTVRCGTGCVNTQNEPGHCGACDQPCAASEACQGGTCGCSEGLTQCGGGCFNTNQNPLHCGACDNPCTNGQTCQNGTCACTDPDATACGNACVELQSNTQHCGGCDIACEAGLPCTDGECRCPEGQQLCEGECVDTESDPAHCGQCGSPCPDGESCIVGTCSGAVGDACTSELAHGISITEIAVYQSGKIGLMDGGSALAADSREVDVVAGKNSIVRAFVQLESGWTNRVVSARLTLINGDELEQVFHKRTVEGASSEDSLGTTFNIEVDGDLITPSTRYALELVECEASTGTQYSPRFPASGDEALQARDVGVLRIQYVPVIANGIEANSESSRLDMYSEYMEAMYPVSAVQYTVGDAMQANSSVSANGNGWSQVLQQLSQRHQSDNAPNDLYYYGLVEPASSINQYCQGGCVAGVGYVPGSNTRNAHSRVSIGISYGNQGSADTMAHEVGHNHGRPHAPCGSVSDAEQWPYSGQGRNGAPIGWWGFRYPDELIPGTQASDIMGYCEDKWVSDYNYNNFMERVSILNGATSFINPNPVGAWQVIVTSAFGLSWGVPPRGEVVAVGVPEAARILDSIGDEIAQVTVYRALMDHLNASSVMVPTPEPGWHAIVLDGELPMVFGSSDASQL